MTGAILNLPITKLHSNSLLLLNRKYTAAPQEKPDASGKTCNSTADSPGNFKLYHLGISINVNSCKVGCHFSHQCLKFVGSSSSHSNFRFHNSWMISLDSRVAGASIPKGSDIELIKLRMHLFEVVKFYFQPWWEVRRS